MKISKFKEGKNPSFFCVYLSLKIICTKFHLILKTWILEYRLCLTSNKRWRYCSILNTWTDDKTMRLVKEKIMFTWFWDERDFNTFNTICQMIDYMDKVFVILKLLIAWKNGKKKPGSINMAIQNPEAGYDGSFIHLWWKNKRRWKDHSTCPEIWFLKKRSRIHERMNQKIIELSIISIEVSKGRIV